MRLRSVPRATGFIMIWLPFCRETRQPKLSNTFTASLAFSSGATSIRRLPQPDEFRASAAARVQPELPSTAESHLRHFPVLLLASAPDSRKGLTRHFAFSSLIVPPPPPLPSLFACLIQRKRRTRTSLCPHFLIGLRFQFKQLLSPS